MMSILKEKNIDISMEDLKSMTNNSIIMKKKMADEKNSII